MQPETPPVHNVPPVVKILVTVLIVFHFFAILTAVIAPPPPNGLPSAVYVGAYQLVRPYLNFTMLTNAYRFYAPDPGPTHLVWFRIADKAGEVRWVELPDRSNHILRMPFQRRLCMAMSLEGRMNPHPEIPNAIELNPEGRILISAMVRKLARLHGAAEGIEVESIRVYSVPHRVREPSEVQLGMAPTDPRLYTPRYLGSYKATGESLTSAAAQGLLDTMGPLPMSQLAADVISEDYYARLQQGEAETVDEVVNRLKLPIPIHNLLVDYESLRNPTLAGGDLAGRIRDAVADSDDRVTKSRMQPGRDYLVEW